MSEEAEIIDSSEMRILSEFAFEGDEKVLEQVRETATTYRIGLLDGNILIADKDELQDTSKILEAAKNGTERHQIVVADWKKRDWWRVKIIFEIKNFNAVLTRLEEIYQAQPAREIDLNAFEITGGEDEIGVRINSVMPHNVGKPIVTLQIVNARTAKIDAAYETKSLQLITTPETGRRLMSEMQKLKPVIEEKLLNG